MPAKDKDFMQYKMHWILVCTGMTNKKSSEIVILGPAAPGELCEAWKDHSMTHDQLK